LEPVGWRLLRHFVPRNNGLIRASLNKRPQAAWYHFILVGSHYWSRLIDWFHNTLVSEGTLSAGDLELFQVIDTPQEVVNSIFDYYQHKRFEPSEQEKLLEL
jgi:predicted Rossmann-fold nucleotide-binding protein